MNDFNDIADALNRISDTPLLRVRNFIIDYHDRNGASLHGVIQLMDPCDCSDAVVVETIIQQGRDRNEKVYSIIEVMGRHTLKEVYRMLEGPEKAAGVTMRSIYLDKAQALI